MLTTQTQWAAAVRKGAELCHASPFLLAHLLLLLGMLSLASCDSEVARKATSPKPGSAPATVAPSLQVAVGNSHACAWSSTGQVRCWGLNSSGQLGLGAAGNRGDTGGEMGTNLPAVDLGTGRTAIAITLGGNHSCARLDNAQVKCWGLNSNGQLGLGDTLNRGDAGGEMGDSLPAVDLGAGRTATALALGGNHSCALLDNAQVKCWGYNPFGQLGLGDTLNRGDAGSEMGDNLPFVALGTGRTAAAIAAGNDHTCALLDNAQVKCWGTNFSGRLGLGDTAHRGDVPGEMGDSLPVVDLGTGRTATAIASGGAFNCALLDDAQMKCWGDNAVGELGLGDTAHRGDAPGEMGDSLPVVDLGTGRTAATIAVGGGHVCALLDNTQVKCWGFNNRGQLGQGDTLSRGDAGGEMGDSLPAVDVGTGRTVAAIASANTGYLNCALLDNVQVKCWGSNFFGELGQGDTAHRGDNPSEMGDNLLAVDLGIP